MSSVPGGMATAILAGVHPIQGLYACFAGPIAGGLTAASRGAAAKRQNLRTGDSLRLTPTAHQKVRAEEPPGGRPAL
jgi:hypothetical protein